MNEGKHFGMGNALTRRKPLNVAVAKAGGGAERIRMVNQPLANPGDRLETPVRVLGKARYHFTVIHAPTVFTPEIIAQISTLKRGIRPHGFIALRIGIVMVDTEQKRVRRLPRKPQGADFFD